MVGVVGLLSVSMIVSTPSNAQAFAGGDTLLKEAPRIAGAIKTISPAITTAAAVATSVTPLGWALKGAWMLGMLAFNTSDIWMPYVTGALGTAEEDTRASTPPNSQVFSRAEHRLGAWTVEGSTLKVRTYWTGPGGSGSFTSFHVAFAYECRWADGTTTVFKNKLNLGNQPLPFDLQVGMSCQATQGGVQKVGTPIAGAAGLAGDGILPVWVTGDKPGGPADYTQWGGFNTKTFDPRSADVGYEGRSECIDAAGTVSWISGPRIGGDAGGVQMPSCEAAGKGHGTGRTQVIAFKPDGTQLPVWSTPVAPSDPSTPMCDPGKSSGGCVLSVELDGKGCEAGNVECENWAEIQKQDPNNTRLKCRFGPYTLPMSACNLLEQAYRVGGAIATELNTDGDPATRDDNNYAGQPVPQPAPGSVAAPGPGAVPGTGGQLGPQADAEQKECFPSGWGMLNPVEWVMKPVGCALDAAFKPKREIQPRITAMQGQFANKVPISWFGGTMQGVSGGSCPTNWGIEVAGQHVSFICGTPAEGIVLAFRPVLGAMLIIAALWPLIRSLFYSAIPILKVNPS